MAVLSVRQVYDLWVYVGGPTTRGVEFVAIAIAESSLDTGATSVTDARGLWQEEPFWAGVYGYTPADLYNPQVNALIATKISGGGQNCAAWDTAYADINASGRYSFLGFPEHGSAASNNLPYVQNLLRGVPAPTQQQINPPPIGQELPSAVARWQDLGGRQIPGQAAALQRIRAAVDRLYVR